MADDFDPYYLWLGIPPHERPANHYRLLGIELFEQNPSVIESAADRQMAHLRTVQAGKHSTLSQKLLNEVAAAKVCLLRPPQKAKYDQALHARIDALAKQSTSAAQLQTAAAVQAQPRPLAQAQPIVRQAPAPSESESFWDDVTGGAAAQSPGMSSKSTKSTKSLPRAAAPAPNRLKKFWPLFLAMGACLLVAAAIAVKSMSGEAGETPSGGDASSTTALTAKPKASLLVFEWPAEGRSGLTLLVDGAKVVGPPSGPWEYRCPPGPHHIVASRPGFKPIDRMVDAPVDSSRKIADVWQPLATLALDWPLADRDGAVLTLDGQLLTLNNDQPLTLPVEPGTHTVRITRIGFTTLEKEIPVAPDQHQSTSIALEPVAATLVVRWPAAERAGGELRVDGEIHSMANDSNSDKVEMQVKPGTHTVAIKRPGFEAFMQTVTLASASRKTLRPAWTAESKPSSETASQPPDSKAPPGPGDSAPVVRHPIPSATDQQRVAKELDQIYKLAHDPTKDLAQAKELCNLALKANDLTERYMLLLKGADFAIEGGDFSLAMQSIDTLGSEFAVPSLDVKEKLLERFAKIAVTADQITDAVGTANRLIDDSIASDRYEMVAPIASAASKMLLKKAVDSDFRRDSEKGLTAYRAEVKTLQPQWDLAQKAKQTLESNPADSNANGVLGRWYGFYKGDWKRGVPLLAKSGNEKIKPVAEQELRAGNDATQKVAAADQWWDVAQKEVGPVADAIHLHAGDLYRGALPDLTSVLKKAAVEKRIAEVAEISSRIGEAAGQHSGPMIFQRGRWYDVLKLVDVNRDASNGTWTRNGSDIICASSMNYYRNLPRLYLPVVLDGGYDLAVDFTRGNENSFVHTIFFLGPRPAGLVLNANFSGLDGADGDALNGFYRRSYGTEGARFQSGRRYSEVFNVRLGKGGVAGVDVWIDGRQFLPHWEGDPSGLGIDSQSRPDPKQLALEVGFGGSVAFNAARLRMVSGQGHFESLQGGSSGRTPVQPTDPMPNKPFVPAGTSASSLPKQNADGTIRFAAADAQFHGKQIRLERPGQGGNIGNWTDPDDWVEWKFAATKPGTYSVMGEIAAQSGGNFTVSITGSPVLQATAPSSGSFDTYRFVDLGKIDIVTASPVSLTVKPVKAGWQPMNLQSLMLKPAQ